MRRSRQRKRNSDLFALTELQADLLDNMVDAGILSLADRNNPRRAIATIVDIAERYTRALLIKKFGDRCA